MMKQDRARKAFSLPSDPRISKKIQKKNTEKHGEMYRKYLEIYAYFL